MSGNKEGARNLKSLSTFSYGTVDLDILIYVNLRRHFLHFENFEFSPLEVSLIFVSEYESATDTIGDGMLLIWHLWQSDSLISTLIVSPRFSPNRIKNYQKISNTNNTNFRSERIPKRPIIIFLIRIQRVLICICLAITLNYAPRLNIFPVINYLSTSHCSPVYPRFYSYEPRWWNIRVLNNKSLKFNIVERYTNINWKKFILL